MTHDKWLNGAAAVIQRAADDLEYFNNQYDRERLARHYEALAMTYETIPSPSWMRGEELQRCKAELAKKHDEALAKAKGLRA